MATALETDSLPRSSTGQRALKFANALVRQLIWRSAMLLFVALVVFVILRLIPADPIGMLLPPGASPEDVRQLTRELGLDRSVPVQFLIWGGNLLHGDLGRSIAGDEPVLDVVLTALPTTLEFLFFGIFLGGVLGGSMGLLTFQLRGTPFEKLLTALNSVMIAIPDYLWAILLIMGFGVALQWLPFIGEIGAGYDIDRVTGFLLVDSLISGDINAFFSVVAHLILPALALGLCLATPIARVMHSSLIETYQEEYIIAARVRGVARRRLLLSHALRNACLPTISLIGVQTSVLIGGTILVEMVFSLPGIGSLMLRSLRSYDLPVIQALALVYGIIVQLISALIDFIHYRLDPRLRVQS